MDASENVGAISPRVFIAIDDATSPPTWPPMPSATAIVCELISAESSFPFRTNPTAERALAAK